MRIGTTSGGAPVREAERLTYLKLMERYQNLDLFRFILYAAKAGQPVPRVETDGRVYIRGLSPGPGGSAQ